MPQELLDTYDEAVLMNIVENDVPKLGAIVDNLLGTVDHTLNIIMLIISILLVSLPLAGASVLFLLTQVTLLMCYRGKMVTMAAAQQEQRSRLKNVTIDVVTKTASSKALFLEEVMITAARKEVGANFNLLRDIRRYRAGYQRAQKIITRLGMTVLFFIAMLNIASGAVPVSAFLPAFIQVGTLNGKLVSLFAEFTEFINTKAAVQVTQKVMQAQEDQKLLPKHQPLPPPPKLPTPLPIAAGIATTDKAIRFADSAAAHGVPLETPMIELRDVSWAVMDADKRAIQRRVTNNITLRVPRGAKVALIGPSAAGKSTTLKLVTGLYQPLSGQILLEGRPVRSWPKSDLARMMVTVEQTWCFFDGTIRENILKGAPPMDEVTLEQTLDWALDAACLSDSVAALPDGLETEIEGEARTLSRGFQQRLVIARALMRRTPLIVLDEPVAALDPTDSANMMNMLRVLSHQTLELPPTTFGSDEGEGDEGDERDERERMSAPVAAPERPASEMTTVICATHDLVTTSYCDYIVYLDKGCVLEQGPREELLKADGPYSKMLRRSQGLSLDSKGVASVTPERLQQAWLFSSAPLSALTDLAKAFSSRTYKDGKLILEQVRDLPIFQISPRSPHDLPTISP